MALYGLVDRATSTVIKRKQYENPKRNLSKPIVWLPINKTPPPAHDSEIEKLVSFLTIPDLSDLGQGVDPAAVIAEGHNKVTLTAQEIDDRKEDEVFERIQNMKMLIMALNDGSFVPGQNYTLAQLKAKFKAHI